MRWNTIGLLDFLLLLAFRHADACLTLLRKIWEEWHTEWQSLGLFTIRFSRNCQIVNWHDASQNVSQMSRGRSILFTLLVGNALTTAPVRPFLRKGWLFIDKIRCIYYIYYWIKSYITSFFEYIYHIIYLLNIQTPHKYEQKWWTNWNLLPRSASTMSATSYWGWVRNHFHFNGS